jgi:hypothetical protein
MQAALVGITWHGFPPNTQPPGLGRHVPVIHQAYTFIGEALNRFAVTLSAWNSGSYGCVLTAGIGMPPNGAPPAKKRRYPWSPGLVTAFRGFLFAARLAYRSSSGREPKVD